MSNIELLWLVVIMLGLSKIITIFLVVRILRLGKEVHDIIVVSRGYQQLTENTVVSASQKLDKVDENVKLTKSNVEEIKAAVTDGNGPLSSSGIPKPPLPS